MSKRKASIASPAAPSELLGDIRALIEVSRQCAALAVNAELTLLFWRVGHRIHTEVLAGQRAGYGEEILPTLTGKQGRSLSNSSRCQVGVQQAPARLSQRYARRALPIP